MWLGWDDAGRSWAAPGGGSRVHEIRGLGQEWSWAEGSISQNAPGLYFEQCQRRTTITASQTTDDWKERLPHAYDCTDQRRSDRPASKRGSDSSAPRQQDGSRHARLPPDPQAAQHHRAPALPRGHGSDTGPVDQSRRLRRREVAGRLGKSQRRGLRSGAGADSCPGGRVRQPARVVVRGRLPRFDRNVRTDRDSSQVAARTRAERMRGVPHAAVPLSQILWP